MLKVGRGLINVQCSKIIVLRRATTSIGKVLCCALKLRNDNGLRSLRATGATNETDQIGRIRDDVMRFLRTNECSTFLHQISSIQSSCDFLPQGCWKGVLGLLRG